MRDGVIVAGIFIGTAVALLVIAATLIPAIAWMQRIVQGLGLLLLLFVPFILITTYLRSGRRPDSP
jgi:formate/nitrite transporter FocA (FNT family)